MHHRQCAFDLVGNLCQDHVSRYNVISGEEQRIVGQLTVCLDSLVLHQRVETVAVQGKFASVIEEQRDLTSSLSGNAIVDHKFLDCSRNGVDRSGRRWNLRGAKVNIGEGMRVCRYGRNVQDGGT